MTYMRVKYMEAPIWQKNGWIWLHKFCITAKRLDFVPESVQIESDFAVKICYNKNMWNKVNLCYLQESCCIMEVIHGINKTVQGYVCFCWLYWPVTYCLAC